MATQLSAPTSTTKKRIRKVFGNIHEVVQMPNLIEVQRESYEQFLRSDASIGLCLGSRKDAPLGVPDSRFRWHRRA